MILKKYKKTKYLAFKIIYSMEHNFTPIQNINLSIFNNNQKIDLVYLQNIIKIYKTYKDKINKIFFKLKKKNTIINDLDKIIIEISIIEYYFIKKINLNIIINESIKLSKQFSNKNNYMLVNKIISNIIHS